jgi:hypothetical protein
MDKNEFVKVLRATGEALAQIVAGISYSGIRRSRSVQPGPEVREWLVKLAAMANLIEAQDGPISVRQLNYLRLELSGLNDLRFDPKLHGDLARVVNDDLERHWRALDSALRTG